MRIRLTVYGSELLNSHEDLRDVEILSGFVEHETKLPFGERGPRCHDLMVCAVRHGEPVTICIEAKADEAFGGTIQAELEKVLASATKRSGDTRFPERLDWLTRFLFGESVFMSMGITTLEPAFSGLFYQLLSAIGGTLIEAKIQCAGAAVLIFNEFRTHATEDRKLQLNAEALDSFLRVFLHANGRAGGWLKETYLDRYGSTRTCPIWV